jgi:hypothetical protein
LARDYERSEDASFLAFNTEGQEEAIGPEPKNIAAFGDLIGEWSWSSIGIPSGYRGCAVGLTYPYMYLPVQVYGRVYQISVASGAPAGARYITYHVTYPWGAGSDNDGQVWIGSVYPSLGDNYNYEYDGMPWPMSQTGNRFYAPRGSVSWMGGMTDNAPGDTIWQLGVGYGEENNALWGFEEPSGTHARNFYHDPWADYSYSQRGATYNEDAHTFIVGGWNADHIWEIAYDDGAPIPMRDIAPGGGVSGLGYQAEAHDGTAKLWVQHNSSTDHLQCWDWSPPAEDDIAIEAILEPNFPIIGQAPLAVVATLANLGTLGQTFDTWVEVTWPGDSWTSTVITMTMASYDVQDVTYEAWPNGLPQETEAEICVYVDNPGDEYPDNNEMCTGVKVGRDCWQYAGDDGIARNFMYFGGAYYAMVKRIFQPGVTDPVAAAWIAVNTCSKGEAYYPWPDPVYDPILICAYTDNDGNGSPDQSSMDPVWSMMATPSDAPNWVVVDVPECAFLGQGGVMWAGFRNPNYPTEREGLGLSYTAGDYELWYGYYNNWYSYPYYQGAMIRACLEYPPLVALTGLDEFHWTPPYPPLPENLCTVPFTARFCGAVEGTFSCSGLTRQKVFGWEPDIFIPPHKIFFIPPAIKAEGGDVLTGEMKILVPVHALWGEYTGKVFLNYGAGVEEYDFKLVIEHDPDLDVRDNYGDLSGNSMTLMGVRDGMAVGAFHLVNPNMFENNFDQFDGPANSHLFNGTATITDLTFCAGGPDPKEPIPASDVNLMLGKDLLASGEGTYGLVTVNIPFYAKHWHQQYDFGYCAEVTVEYEDMFGYTYSDMFDVYLMVLKSHGGMNCGFWGENVGNSNVIHWGNLGIGEEGYALYRDGIKLADFVEEYEYADNVATSNACEYSLGVKVGGSEVMIGPITVGGRRPSVFSLGQNHPNPVSDHTSIRYTIAEASDVSIGVYNSAGMLVKNLVNEYRTPGVYTVSWDNVDLSNGVYFYRMNAGDFNMTHKMVVMK